MALFPETTFGFVCRVRAREDADRKSMLETLCKRYWTPVHAYVRAAWTRDPEKAQDVTQEFFTWLMGEEVLSQYAPERGSFRGYLKGLLRNFERNRRRTERSQKRGGSAALRSLDEHELTTEDPDPAAAFDQAWLKELMERAVGRLRVDLTKERHERRWLVFEAYELATEKPTYKAVAERLGVKEGDVRNDLHHVREKFRDELRAELADTVTDLDSLEEEWRALVGA